jgi:hypothetical protein
MSAPTPTLAPIVVLIHQPGWMTTVAFWLSLATAVIGVAWAVYRYSRSGPRIEVQVDTFLRVAGITVRFTSHDYAYTVVVANTGGAATRVRGVLLELRNGSIMAATSLESPQPDASGSYNLPSHDQLRWSYGLDLFRNAGSPEGDPPTVDVRPVVEWGAGRTLIGSWRTVRLDGQPLRFGGGEETLEIGSPPAQGGQIEDASP